MSVLTALSALAPPLVVEIGHKHIRCGVAGEPTPRHIRTCRPEATVANRLLDALQRAPAGAVKGRVVALLCPEAWRQRAGTTLFRVHKAAAVLWLSSAMAVGGLMGDTVLSVDAGWAETRVEAVILGTVVAEEHGGWGGEAVDAQIVEVLIGAVGRRDVPRTTPFAVAMAEQVRLQCRLDAEDVEEDATETILLGEQQVVVSRAALTKAAQMIYFGHDDSSLADMIVDAILASPIDQRKGLANNIVVHGGNACAMGYVAGLGKRVRDALDERALPELKACVRVTTPSPYPASLAQWIGASLIVGAGDVAHDPITMKQCDEQYGGQFPDLASIAQ